MSKVVLLKSMRPEEQPMPVIRPGREYWDRCCALQRFSFMRGNSNDGTVLRVPDVTGNWIDVHEAQQLVDEMQTELNTLREQLAHYNGAV